jgi:hypothetical protein
MIFNLAKIKLSIYEQQVLSKGLKFCPTPMSNKTAIYEMAISELKRKLLLQAYHVGKDPDVNSTPITPITDPNLAFNKNTNLSHLGSHQSKCATLLSIILLRRCMTHS